MLELRPFKIFKIGGPLLTFSTLQLNSDQFALDSASFGLKDLKPTPEGFTPVLEFLNKVCRTSATLSFFNRNS